MDRVPVRGVHLDDVARLRHIVDEDVSRLVLDPSDERQVEARPAVGNRRDVSCKSDRRVVGVALSDGGTDSVLRGHLRTRFLDLHAGLLIESVEIRVFGQLADADVRDVLHRRVIGVRDALREVFDAPDHRAGIFPVRSRAVFRTRGAGISALRLTGSILRSLRCRLLHEAEPVAHLVEIVIAGIVDGLCEIQHAVRTGINPAVRLRLSDLREHTRAVDGRIRRDGSLQKARRRNERLERGAGRCPLLRRVVDERMGIVIAQLLVIVRVHLIRHPVVVKARIRNHREHIPRIDVRDDHGAGIRIEVQLGRRKIQVFDAVPHELVARLRPGSQCRLLRLPDIDAPLLHEKVAHLLARDGVGQDHVMVNMLDEIAVLRKRADDIVHELLIHLVGAGILLLHFHVGDVDPVLRNRVFQVLRHRDRLILRPGNIGLVILIDPAPVDDVIAVQGLDDVALVILVLVRQHAVRRQRARHLVAQLRRHI